MGQIRHPRPSAARALDRQPLQGEPEDQHDPGGEAQRQEEEEREQARDPGPGEQVEERPEHRRDRPRRADERLVGRGVRGGVGDQGEVAAGDVEEGELGTAHAFLGHHPEHVQEEHVAEQMQPAAVHEEGGERGEQGASGAVPQLARDHAPLFEVPRLGGEQGVGVAVGRIEAGERTDQEDQAAQGDQGVGHGRSARGDSPQESTGQSAGRGTPIDHEQSMTQAEGTGQTASPCPGDAPRP